MKPVSDALRAIPHERFDFFQRPGDAIAAERTVSLQGRAGSAMASPGQEAVDEDSDWSARVAPMALVTCFASSGEKGRSPVAEDRTGI